MAEAEMDLGGMNAMALFGDAGDIGSDEDDDAAVKPLTEDGGARWDDDEDNIVRRGAVIEDDEDENKEEEPPENRIEVEIPRMVTQLGSNPHYVKLPNFLSVETRSETKHQFDCYNLILTA